MLHEEAQVSMRWHGGVGWHVSKGCQAPCASMPGPMHEAGGDGFPAYSDASSGSPMMHLCKRENTAFPHSLRCVIRDHRDRENGATPIFPLTEPCP